MRSDRIKQARINAGLTQEELATMCGTVKQTIYKYEKGIINNIPFDKLRVLAKALNVSEAYLMGWQEHPRLSSVEKYNGIFGNPKLGFSFPEGTEISPNRKALLDFAETATDEQISLMLRLAKAVLEQEK